MQGASRRNQVVAQLQEFPSTGYQYLRSRSRPDSFAVPHQEGNLQLLFEIFDLRAEGRLRQVKLLRGAGDVSCFYNRYKVFQIPEFHSI